jgi:hypothetical protein
MFLLIRLRFDAGNENEKSIFDPFSSIYRTVAKAKNIDFKELACLGYGYLTHQ